MQLSFSFSFLLTALLLALTRVEASPTEQSSRTVTLPLKRLPQPSDVHPSILLRRGIDRAHRRHARMTGREVPSTVEPGKRLNVAEPLPSLKRHNARIGGSSFVNVNNRNADPKDGFPKAGLAAQLAGGLTKAKKPTAKNSLGLDVRGNDAGYIATIQVGTPPRDFSVLMDSGSGDFWVGGEGCKTDVGGTCVNHPFLGNHSSSTFQDTGKPWHLELGSGSGSGNIVIDNVNIAGLALNKHTFGVFYTETEDIANNSISRFDGIMGLAKFDTSNQGVLSPVETLAKQGLISQAITSYKISRVSDGLNDGEITFGGLDSSKFDSKTLVTVKNVNKKGFWEAPFTVSVGGKNLGLQGRTAILDTGTIFIIAPPADVKAVHAKIPGSKSDTHGEYTLPCNNTAVVSLTFGGRAFDINPIDLLFDPVDHNNLKGDCSSIFAAREIFGNPKEWLVGDPFLKNVYFSHNVDKNEISFAKLV